MDSYIGLMSNPLTKCPSSAGKFIRPERTYALMKSHSKQFAAAPRRERSFQMACLMVNVVSIACAPGRGVIIARIEYAPGEVNLKSSL